jgi:cyclopropane-fatty-acyl-phospholipid synthase
MQPGQTPTRARPLGIGATSGSGSDRQPRNPNSVDRWVASQLARRMDPGRVSVALWDESGQVDKTLAAVLQIGDPGALWMLAANPGLRFGDLYSSGRIRVQGDLMAVVEQGYRKISTDSMTERLRRFASRLPAPNLADSRRNIHHHYDLGNDFYRLWLDRDALQYTCAYYADPSMTLEQAQQAKMHHVCRKLRLQRGNRVVEAGSGWGGFALFMAKHYGVKVRSFNIAREQVQYARDWVKREDLSDQVEFVEDDFRNIAGEYDAFVSIGMLEHVGPANYAGLGRLMDRVLAREGRGLVHTIGRDAPRPLNAWIDRRIFPGAYPPTLRQMMELFEPNGLSVLDVENIRLHYAKTLQDWLDRYEQNVDQVHAMFDENFVRAWRLYLTGSIAGFVHGSLQLFQVLFARSGANEIPWTRADIYPQ